MSELERGFLDVSSLKSSALSSARSSVASFATATTTIASPTPSDAPIFLNSHSLEDDSKPTKKGFRFWAIIVSLLVSEFLSALDLTAAATALPTISNSLRATDYTFIGTAYTIASAAIIPWAGGLANIFGRRPVLLAGLASFGMGSVLCGEATNLDMMLAGRSFQGLGSGVILTLTGIILADLVSLAERGAYQGVFAFVWALASATGPVVGAATAETNWRWLFRMNYPATVVIAVIVASFVNLKAPPGSLREKARQVDWLGNAVFIPSISLFVIGLTWGGNQHPWVSPHVLATLLIGAVGLGAWVALEYWVVEHPTVPFKLMSNRTTWIGFFTTFVQGISTLALFFYWPSFFQSTKNASPVRSSIDFFPVTFCIAPFAVLAGLVIAKTGKYLHLNIFAWVLMTAGPGILYLVKFDSPVALWASLPIPWSIGLGLLYAATTFPVLAPLPPQLASQAIAFLAFARSFGNILGITVGSTTLANELDRRLPAAYLATLPGGSAANAFASIPGIPLLAEPLQTQVKEAFGNSIRTIWLVLIPFGFVGLVAACFMREVKLQTETDESWGIEKHKRPEAERSASWYSTSSTVVAEEEEREKEAKDVV